MTRYDHLELELASIVDNSSSKINVKYTPSQKSRHTTVQNFSKRIKLEIESQKPAYSNRSTNSSVILSLIYARLVLLQIACIFVVNIRMLSYPKYGSPGSCNTQHSFFFLEIAIFLLPRHLIIFACSNDKNCFDVKMVAIKNAFCIRSNTRFANKK